MVQSGWWAPHPRVKLHWSLPVIGGLLGLIYGSPAVALGALGLVAVHGLGHVLALRSIDLPFGALELHGLGGDVRGEDGLSAKHRSMVAWGGVMAQLALYFLALGLQRGGVVLSAPLELVLTELNLLLIFLNLIPLHPFDGAEAWLLPARTRARREGYARRQIAIARALVEEERRRREDPLTHELRAALRGAPEPGAPREEAEAAALSSFEEAIQAEELPVDPSYELPDEEIPETLVQEMGDLIAGILRGDKEP